MSIVSSSITKDRDHGFARFIEESHTDTQGVSYIRRRFVPHGYDASADLSSHAAELENTLAEMEAREALNND